MSSLIDPIQRFFCHLLEFHHMELFLRLQHIDQMVRDPLHLFWPNLRRSDIHMPVDLHGICGNDFSANRFGKSD